MIQKRLLFTAVLLAVLLAACSGDEGSDDAAAGSSGTAASSKLTVITTTTQIHDMAKNVAGDRAEVKSIVGANQDPHDFEPSPQDARTLESAGLVLRHGLDFDKYADNSL